MPQAQATRRVVLTDTCRRQARPIAPGFGWASSCLRIASRGNTCGQRKGTPMLHHSHPRHPHLRHQGDTLRRVVLASPFIVAGAFLCFVLIMVLVGVTNGFEPNP